MCTKHKKHKWNTRKEKQINKQWKLNIKHYSITTLQHYKITKLQNYSSQRQTPKYKPTNLQTPYKHTKMHSKIYQFILIRYNTFLLLNPFVTQFSRSQFDHSSRWVRVRSYPRNEKHVRQETIVCPADEKTAALDITTKKTQHQHGHEHHTRPLKHKIP